MESLRPEIIFENEHFIVVNKPSGLVVHPYDRSTEITLLDYIQAHYPEMMNIKNEKSLLDGRTIQLGGLVHKLDRDTSGVLVIAKNEAAFNELKKQFTEHTIQKKYIALVDGVVELNSFRIDAPLGRNKKEYKQRVRPHNPRGELREAITDVDVIKRGESTTLLELVPHTGRTHQLRAHMNYIEHPIVGDIAYGSITPYPRIMLHAEKLAFSLFGEDYMFEVKHVFTI
jgi:23S rRNA pseudouridine1911/1915/1917 synthase